MNDMKIELTFNGQTLTMEGPAEELRNALRSALESNKEFYLMAKDIVAAMMYEEIQDRVAAELATRTSSRIMNPRRNGKHKN